MALKKEQKIELLLENIEILKENIEENAYSIGNALEKLIKFNSDIAFDVWVNLLRNKKVLKEYALTQSMIYNFSEDSPDKMVDFILANSDEYNKLIKSPEYDVCSFGNMARHLINQEKIQNINDVITKLLSTKGNKVSFMGDVLNELDDDNVSEDLTEMLLFHINSFKNKQEKAKLITYIIDYI
ncbi:hypothetical protein KGF36_11405 [Clostridioides sp. ZZV14-6009]|uniref:hypothetical protein n=1 Tax=unclassified Clostridioides TaxID=2635829 RepID=UPI001D126E83|nr:hypothetical protein [Clostridioides sp. ES-S-0049-03]MCC0735247.1 hypothetical protein [Clostridioides sp. ZZV14-6009]